MVHHRLTRIEQMDVVTQVVLDQIFDEGVMCTTQHKGVSRALTKLTQMIREPLVDFVLIVVSLLDQLDQTGAGYFYKLNFFGHRGHQIIEFFTLKRRLRGQNANAFGLRGQAGRLDAGLDPEDLELGKVRSDVLNGLSRCRVACHDNHVAPIDLVQMRDDFQATFFDPWTCFLTIGIVGRIGQVDVVMLGALSPCQLKDG